MVYTLKWVMAFMALSGIQCSSPAQAHKADQEKKSDEYLIENIENFKFSRGQPHRRGNNIECPRFSDIGGRELGVIHPYFCKGPAYRANYSSDTTSADVQVILHQDSVASWIKHDLFWFLAQFTRKENRIESDDSYVLMPHRAVSQWIAGVRIQPRRSKGEEKEKESPTSYYDRYLGWVTKENTLILIEVWKGVKKNGKMPFPDAVVKEYLNRFPSILQESDFQKDRQTLIKQEVGKCIAYMRAEIHADITQRSIGQFQALTSVPLKTLESVTQYYPNLHGHGPIIGRAIAIPSQEVLRQILNEIYRWWEENKDKTPLDWFDAAFEPYINKLEEVAKSNNPRENDFAAYLTQLSIALGGIYPPPYGPRTKEEIERSKTAWRKWWSEFKGKRTLAERIKMTIRTYMDFLDEDKLSDTTWKQYSEALRRLDRITQRRIYPYPAFDTGQGPASVTEGIRFWKKWWEENKDTYNPEE